MSEENILLSWAKTGIWLYKLLVVLDKIATIRLETLLETTPNTIATPYTTKKMRQFNCKYAKKLSIKAWLKLIKANEINAALAFIANYRAKGLKEALINKKSKRRRGKKLNLSGEPSRRA